MTKIVYNVRVSVIALIEAESEDDAIDQLWRSLDGHGFDTYDDPGANGTSSAFESEDIGGPPFPLPRPCGH